MMEIVYGQVPPNYKEIAEKFGISVKENPGIVFTYGHKLFIPSGIKPDIYLLKHEETHALQQTKMGIEEWWKKYLSDRNFRFLQELEAYRTQYASMGSLPLRHRIGYLDHICRDLAGPMYGNLISPEDARIVITNGIKLRRPKSASSKPATDSRKLKKRQRQARKKGRR